MKRLFLGAIALGLAVTVTGGVYAATTSSVKFEMGSKNVSCSYNADSDEETVTKANNLFDLSSLKDGKKKNEELKITSISKDGDRVVVSLRLEIEQADNEAQASVLDYYDFVITDSNGQTVYSSVEAQPTEINALHKDIPLGVFNTQFTTDVKTYNVEYSINEDNAALIEAVKAKTLQIEAVAAIAKDTKQVTEISTENTEPTLQPQIDLNMNPTEPTELTEPLASPTPTEESNEKKEVKKVCGKDIDPGRYMVSGNGVITITTEDDKIKSETTVTDGKLPNVEGTEGFVTNLELGDVITVIPPPGMEKAAVTFEKTNVLSENNTTKANNTSAKTVADTKSTKTNPKTGDMGLTLGVLGAFMGVSAASFAGLGRLKKKKK